jgi:hypothetical protein
MALERGIIRNIVVNDERIVWHAVSLFEVQTQFRLSSVLSTKSQPVRPLLPKAGVPSLKVEPQGAKKIHS